MVHEFVINVKFHVEIVAVAGEAFQYLFGRKCSRKNRIQEKLIMEMCTSLQNTDKER